VATANSLCLEVLGDYENVDELDADNADRLARLLNFLRHVDSYVHNFREWPWTYKEGFITAAAPADSYVAYPEDFLELGKQGGLFNPVTGRPMRELSRYQVSRARRLPSASSYVYGAYAQWDNKFFFCSALGTTPIPIFYRRTADDLSEPENPLLLPDKYIRITLLPALVWRTQNMKNDDRAVWAQTMQAGLAQMCVLENPGKNGPQKMPMANRQW
jgi:hypothetical protein